MSIEQFVRGDSELQKIKKFLIFSALAHILFFVGGSVFGSLFDFQDKMEFDSIQAKLVKLGKERDEKLLPRITKKEEPIVKKDMDQKGNTLKKEKVTEKKPKPVKKKPEKKQSLDDLLSGAMKDIKKDARAEVSDEGSKDGVDDGDVTDAALKIKGNLYIRKISNIIRKNWKIPGIISRDELYELNAEVYFRITYSGDIYDISIIGKSGNNIFDSSVIKAIKKTGNLPLPEDRKLRKLVLREGLQWIFKPRH